MHESSVIAAVSSLSARENTRGALECFDRNRKQAERVEILCSQKENKQLALKHWVVGTDLWKDFQVTVSADISHHSSWTLKVTVTKSLRKCQSVTFPPWAAWGHLYHVTHLLATGATGTKARVDECIRPIVSVGSTAKTPRTDKSKRTDRTDRSDIDLTFQVTCVGQLSQFFQCLF